MKSRLPTSIISTNEPCFIGRTFTTANLPQDFSKLRKTITINILGFDWFRNDKRYHHTFHIRDDKTGELLSDDIEVHFLELEKIKKIKRKPADDLEGWMIYLSNLECPEMEAIAMGNPGIRKALTIEQAFMQSKKERRIYELIEKAKRDEISALAGARAEGEARGEAKGMVKGEVKMAQEAICKYLEVKFGEESLDLQEKVNKISKLEALNVIINKIFTANSLQDIYTIVDNA